MSDLFSQPDGAATPLTDDEKRDLKPSSISNRAELNEAEQENILRGQAWALGRERDILTEEFVKKLHYHMFNDVWWWAGKYRTSQRNIGIDYWRIPEDLGNLLADTRTWIEKKSYPPNEIAVRFHHRLVQIHPFPNGNGRFARLAADLLAARLGERPFSWGSESLRDASEARKRYIQALRAADKYDYGLLISFARS
ncbi:MAG: mobile mystery protein B [Bdellovibrionota bacterium]